MPKKVLKALGIDGWSVLGPLGAIPRFFSNLLKKHENEQAVKSGQKIAPYRNIRTLLEKRGIEVTKETIDGDDYNEAVQKQSIALMAVLMQEALKANNMSPATMSYEQTVVFAGIYALLVNVFVQFAHINQDDGELMLNDALAVFYQMEQTDPPGSLDIMRHTAVSQYLFAVDGAVPELKAACESIEQALYIYLADFKHDALMHVFAGFNALMNQPILEPAFEKQAAQMRSS